MRRNASNAVHHFPLIPGGSPLLCMCWRARTEVLKTPYAAIRLSLPSFRCFVFCLRYLFLFRGIVVRRICLPRAFQLSRNRSLLVAATTRRRRNHYWDWCSWHYSLATAYSDFLVNLGLSQYSTPFHCQRCLFRLSARVGNSRRHVEEECAEVLGL